MHYQASILNIKLSKKKNFTISNSQLILNFAYPVLNNINFHKILNDKSHNFPLKSLISQKTFKYYITLGRCIFNYNELAKQLNTKDSSPCYCNEIG